MKPTGGGFGVNGAWLYANGTPIVHLVARTSDLEVGRIEHFALRGNDLDSFLQHLDAESVESSVQDIPGTEAKSVNIHDPDGNHIEVIFGDIPPQGTEKIVTDELDLFDSFGAVNRLTTKIYSAINGEKIMKKSMTKIALAVSASVAMLERTVLPANASASEKIPLYLTHPGQ